jgi:hypothetical protein
MNDKNGIELSFEDDSKEFDTISFPYGGYGGFGYGYGWGGGRVAVALASVVGLTLIGLSAIRW